MTLYFMILFILLQMHPQKTSCSNSEGFKSILTSPAFVDKTMLIKHVLESDQHIIVTTPPKFGRSTTVDMLKTFFEVEVNEFGDSKANLNITSDAINGTENWLCFVNNKLEITKHKDVMRQFGRTPVIKVDFKRPVPSTSLRSFYDIIRICKEVIHRSFKEHEYLLYSEVLSLENKHLIRTWCDQHSYKTKIDNMFMSHGLLSLSKFLQKHFGRKVFVLVDNHDYLITMASSGVENDSELSEMVQFVYSLIDDLVNENSNSVRGAFITGVSQVPTISGLNLSNFQTYSFLEDHSYRGFFGFNKEEVDEIINKCEHYLDPNEIKSLHTNSNGYCSKSGTELYNMFSIVIYLKLNKTGRHVKTSEYPSQVLETLRRPTIKIILNKLLLGEHILVNSLENMYTNDIDIRHCLRKTLNFGDNTTFLLYLMNWGLLTYSKNETTTTEASNYIKVPNNEIKEFLLDM